eukprot:CAMPEP_0178489352 /NCGR_PEP_ID=MMETSP0696-20121128/10331_1 /TAXON_ID=265572 /ORGANISM="Extubocellulus spinifer, Strain CCMP396" /LENGTH=76 /DNA_ID=CAMNT_0020117149 /DNA_START=5 /DNA_END=232 /DNA_ORIENTATION=+
MSPAKKRRTAKYTTAVAKQPPLGSRSGSSRRVRDDMAEGFLAATQQRNENRKQSRLQLSEISKTSINSVEKIAERA